MKYTEDIAKEEIASRTKDPEILIDILREGKDDYISRCAAQNPNCPKEMLVEIFRKGKDSCISRRIPENYNCPPEILVEILKRENNDQISRYAAENPNCPPEAKINWMMKTGKIGKEDPSKHIIEYENKKEDNLSDLKDLLKSF